MIKLAKRYVLKWKNALYGFHLAFKDDLSFRTEVFAIVPVVIFAWYFWPLEGYELMALIISYGLVMIAELINTSLEAALDRLHPVKHHMIGLSKDVAASAVVVAVVILIAIMTLIVLNHI